MSPTAKTTKSSQLKRNERERKRVHQVNDGFEMLRSHLEGGKKNNKKLSKADTLREAVKYIHKLQALLQGDFSQPEMNASYQQYQPMTQQNCYQPEMDFHYQDVSYQTSPMMAPVDYQQYSMQYQQGVMRQSP